MLQSESHLCGCPNRWSDHTCLHRVLPPGYCQQHHRWVYEKARPIVKSISTPNWPRKVEHNAMRVLAAPIWRDFRDHRANCPSARKLCRALAETAKKVDDVQKAVADALAHVLECAIAPSTAIEKVVLQQVADKAVDAVAKAHCVPAVIRSLRVLGVYLCASAGCDLVTYDPLRMNCKCLQDLIITEGKDKAEERVKEILAGGLDELIHPRAA
ncbi:MAG: hypothetical protein QOE72_4676 [Chloroflexota bacterium]|jgi:hypothetical protein|nr:hypothetical protein [Chloroflexota bacterium]